MEKRNKFNAMAFSDLKDGDVDLIRSRIYQYKNERIPKRGKKICTHAVLSIF